MSGNFPITEMLAAEIHGKLHLHVTTALNVITFSRRHLKFDVCVMCDDEPSTILYTCDMSPYPLHVVRLTDPDSIESLFKAIRMDPILLAYKVLPLRQYSKDIIWPLATQYLERDKRHKNAQSVFRVIKMAVAVLSSEQLSLINAWVVHHNRWFRSRSHRRVRLDTNVGKLLRRAYNNV